MKMYTVTIGRTGYSIATANIEANSPEEAAAIALDNAGTYDYSSEFDADYEVVNLEQED